MSNQQTDKITVKIGDADREFFMTYGLLNDLTTVVQNLDDMANISLDPEIRNLVLSKILAERSKSGKVLKVVDLDDVEIEINDVGVLLDWALEHLMNFFIKRLEAAAKMSAQQADRLSNLKPTPAGSKA